MIPGVLRPLAAAAAAGGALTCLWAALPDGAAHDHPPGHVAGTGGGPRGAVLRLDGRSKLVVAPHAHLSPDEGLTIGFWIRARHGRHRQYVVRADGPGGWGLLWSDPDSRPPVVAPAVEVRIGDGAATRRELLATAEPRPESRWTHVVLVLEARRARLLLDGAVVADRTFARDVRAGSGVVTIGDGLTGEIDDMRILRGVPSPESLRDIGALPDDAPGLAAHLDFDDPLLPWRNSAYPRWHVAAVGTPRSVPLR